MITNFSEFLAAKRASNWALTAEDLEQQEAAALVADIQTWGDEKFASANDQLHDWFGLEVPTSLLKEVAMSDLDLAEEIYSGGVSDTCQREILIDAVLKKMGLRNWPINIEGERVAKDFLNQLHTVAPTFGVKIVE